MRRLAALLALCLALVGPAVAQNTNYIGAAQIADPTTPTQQLKVHPNGSIDVNNSAVIYSLTAKGCQQFGAAVSSFFPSVPSGATVAFISIEGQSVRMRDDGTSPTASVGLLFQTGGPWPYQGPLAAAQWIQTGATATISVCFYS